MTNIQTIRTKAIIIGAGPAGSSTSVFLSKAGIDHVIIDREKFPRDKICGDACSGKTVFVIRKADPAWLDEIFNEPESFAPSFGLLISAPNGKEAAIPFYPNQPKGMQAAGFTSTRTRFDQFLFEKACSTHATIFQNGQIQEIVKNGEGVQVSLTHENNSIQITAPFIVGADGAHSIVRKTFIPDNYKPKNSGAGLRAYYTGVTGFHPEQFIELHFLSGILPGYFWIFPLPNGLVNVGIGMPAEQIISKRINLRALMNDIIQHHPKIAHRFQKASIVEKISGWALPMYAGNIPISGQHFLLAGDAANLIDPFTGEGIGNALYSGMIAARAISECLGSERHDAPCLKMHYDDVIYRHLGSELKTSSVLQRLSKYSRLLNLVVGKASKSMTLSNTLSAMMRDADLRKELSRPSFYLKILANR